MGIGVGIGATIPIITDRTAPTTIGPIIVLIIAPTTGPGRGIGPIIPTIIAPITAPGAILTITGDLMCISVGKTHPNKALLCGRVIAQA